MRRIVVCLIVAITGVTTAFADTTCVTMTHNLQLLSTRINPSLLPNKSQVSIPSGSIDPAWTAQAYGGGQWLPTVAPWRGALYNFGTSATAPSVCFNDVNAPTSPLSLPAGYSLVSCQSNITAKFEDIVGRSPDAGTRVYRLRPSGFVGDLSLSDTNYLTYSFDGTNWTPEVPMANIGEAVWVFQPTIISNLQVSSGGFSFDALTPSAGMTATLEYSSDLSDTNSWVTLTNYPGTGTVTNFVDPSDMSLPDQRFYRIRNHR